MISGKPIASHQQAKTITLSPCSSFDWTTIHNHPKSDMDKPKQNILGQMAMP